MHFAAIVLGAILSVSQDASVRAVERYFEIPVTGEIGADITAPGIEAALRLADKYNEIQHIVFHVSSSGGAEEDRAAIHSILQSFDGRFEYHVVIESALSDAVVFPLMADHIYFRSTGTTGAAVAYSLVASTGDVEVDRQINSARAAEFAAIAASKGHNPHIFRCMVVSEFEAHLHRDESGTPIVLGHKDESLEYVRLLDGETTILTLTPDEAVECGLGLRLEDTPLAHLGTEQSPWLDTGQMSRHGSTEVLKAANRLQSIRRRISQAEREIQRAEASIDRARDRVEEAEQVASRESGASRFGAQRVRLQAIDRSITAWRGVQSRLRSLESSIEARSTACARLAFAVREEHEFRQINPPQEASCEPVEMARWMNERWRQADEAIAALQRDRARTNR